MPLGAQQSQKKTQEELQGKLQHTQSINKDKFRELLNKIEAELKDPFKSVDKNQLKELLSDMAKDSTLIIKQSIVRKNTTKNNEFYLPGESNSNGNNTVRELITSFSTDLIKLRRIANYIKSARNNEQFKDISEKINKDIDTAVMDNATLISNYYKWIDKNTAGFTKETQKVFDNAKFNLASSLSKKHQKLAGKFVFSEVKDLAKVVSDYKESIETPNLILPKINKLTLLNKAKKIIKEDGLLKHISTNQIRDTIKQIKSTNNTQTSQEIEKSLLDASILLTNKILEKTIKPSKDFQTFHVNGHDSVLGNTALRKDLEEFTNDLSLIHI